MDDLNAWLAIARAPGLHSGRLGDLPPDAVLPRWLAESTPAELHAAGLEEPTVAALRRPDRERLARDAEWLAAAPARSLVTWGSPAYPPLLAAIPDAPLVLFVAGSVDVLSLPQLAIVGSRNPTPIGRDTAEQFAAHLARAGLVITSGLALGIDAAGHRGALRGGGRTVAVLGCGPDVPYPPQHEALAREIAGHGAVVSELPPGTPPLRHHFPRRNRIISGLALGTLVVEAALQSGSLITARLAGEQGREVFAIPGSIHNTLARGCHRLIRQGAKLVESADDIFAEIGALLGTLTRGEESEATETQAFSAAKLDKDYEILLDALGFESSSIDALVARTGLGADAVASMLLILELGGKVEQRAGGLYSRRLAGKS